MKTIESLQRWLKTNGARSGRGPSWSSMFMIRWVKRIATFAILFAWSIPGPAFQMARIHEAMGRVTEHPKEIGPKDDGFKEDELQKIHDETTIKIKAAGIFADRYADSALKIRTLYPDNKAPADVENHIQASDAARQEVKQLQGTIDENTSEDTLKNIASRAVDKANEAKTEYEAADAADKMARSE